MLVEILKWFGTGLGVAGSALLAARIAASGWGFALFWLSNLLWFVAGLKMDEPSIWSLMIVFTVTNSIGVYRWLFPRDGETTEARLHQRIAELEARLHA